MSDDQPEREGSGAEQSQEHGGAPAVKRPRFTREQCAAFAAPYGRQHREARRWINIGAAADPPELPPFEDPESMPAWWTRHMKQRVPNEIVQAALNASRARRAASPAPANDTGVVDPAPVAASAPFTPSPGSDESEEVAFTRSLVLEYQRELKAAMAVHVDQRDDARITFWANKHNDAVELLKKQKVDARESAKTSGLMISRAEVECEIFAAVKMLLQMQSQREKRVREHLLGVMPELPEGLMENIAGALAVIAQRELDLFRNLQSVRSAADVDFRLAA